MQPFKVTLDDTKQFSKVWNYKGLSIPLDDAHLQFACDYGNVVLRSFIANMVEQSRLAKAKQEAETKPLVSLE